MDETAEQKIKQGEGETSSSTMASHDTKGKDKEVDTTTTNDSKPGTTTKGDQDKQDDKEMWNWIHSIAGGVAPRGELFPAGQPEKDNNSTLFIVPHYHYYKVKERIQASQRWRDKVIGDATVSSLQFLYLYFQHSAPLFSFFPPQAVPQNLTSAGQAVEIRWLQ